MLIGYKYLTTKTRGSLAIQEGEIDPRTNSVCVLSVFLRRLDFHETKGREVDKGTLCSFLCRHGWNPSPRIAMKDALKKDAIM